MSATQSPLLEVRDLAVTLPVRESNLHAVRGVSF